MKTQSNSISARFLGAAALLTACLAAPTVGAVEATYQYFRFTPVALRETPIAANSIQLAEFEFLSGGTPLDLSGVTVTNPGGKNPAAEHPDNIIDGNVGTKWLDFTKTTPLIFDFGAAVTIDAYNFTTANDSAERDPVSWIFEGSEDGTTWTSLDVIENYPTTMARQTVEAGFSLPAALPPIILGFSAAPAFILNGESADLTWETENGTSVEIDQSVGTVADSGTLAVNPPDDSDTTYTLSVLNPQGTTSAQTVVRTVAGGTVNFQYIRFTPIKMRGAGSENSIALAEFEFLNAGTPLDLSGVTVTNPGGNTPAAEVVENVIDGDINTKWLDFNKSALEFDFGAPVAIDAYNFTTAGDAPERDPVQWVLEGSADGVDWTLVENVTAFDFPSPLARFTATQDIPLPGASLQPYIDIKFFADQPTAIAGQGIVLHWEVNGYFDPDSVEIDNGIGAVAPEDFLAVTPGTDTTYTLSVSDSNGKSVTAQASVTFVNPSITDICYADFDAAGDELELLDEAAIVNDFATIPLPGDVSRLRLNPDGASRNGTVWFRRRFDFSKGFDTSFDLHFVTTSTNPISSGADGIAFIIQDDPRGTGARPAESNENGLSDDSLNVTFDSYQNVGEASAAVVRVSAGARVLAEADLTTFPGITLGGNNPSDLTQGAADAPYKVRITYVPGSLNVYFEGVLVIADVDVDLDQIAAINLDGKGFVGFSARTGSEFETHDVTNWCLKEEAPPPDIEIVNYNIDAAAGTATFTWTSQESRSYRITSSTDADDFSTVVKSGISGESGAAQTTATVTFAQAPLLLFRVEEE